MHIVLLGPPGCGKGTQAALISALYSIPHISMGELLRKESKKKTKKSREIKKKFDAGALVPNILTVEVLKKRLKKRDCVNGYVLDGYPRNTNQLKLLGPGFHVDYAIYINVPDPVIIKRMSGRLQCKKCGAVYGVEIKTKKKGLCDKCHASLYHRSDDRPAAIKERLRTFNRLTKPLINQFRRGGVLHEINGDRKPEEIFSHIKKILH